MWEVIACVVFPLGLGAMVMMWASGTDFGLHRLWEWLEDALADLWEMRTREGRTRLRIRKSKELHRTRVREHATYRYQLRRDRLTELRRFEKRMDEIIYQKR